MNVLPDFSSTIRAIAKPESPSSGCDLDCKEKLFHALADRSRLCILQTLCQGAQTVAQIAAARGLSQVDVLDQIKPLFDCGCVTLKRTGDSLRYTLSTPCFLQLEAVVDEFLIASFKAGG
jgi:DNA-binding transcriptional ArsR family regulator